MTTPPAHAIRLGRSAWTWFWRALIVFWGFPLVYFGVRLASGHSVNLALVVAVYAGIGLVWFGICAILAAVRRATWLDPNAHTISLRGGPWIPLTALTYGEVTFPRGTVVLAIGTDRRNVTYVADTFLFGDPKAVRRWAYWVVQSSAIPEQLAPGARGDTRSAILAHIAAWA